VSSSLPVANVEPSIRSADDRFRVGMFGPIEVEYRGRRLGPSGFRGVKPKQILENHLIRRGRKVTKEQVAEALWPDDGPANISATLDTYVSLLRTSLDPGGAAGRSLVVTDHCGYRLAPELVDLDLDRFDALIERAPLVDTAEARQLLATALSLVRGDVLEDEPYLPGTEAIRGRYRQRWIDASLLSGHLALKEFDFGPALERATEIVDVEPLLEPAHRIAMIAAYGSGRQDRAVRAYARCRKALGDELGVEPSPETSAVFDAIRDRVSLDQLLGLDVGLAG